MFANLLILNLRNPTPTIVVSYVFKAAPVKIPFSIGHYVPQSFVNPALNFISHVLAIFKIIGGSIVLDSSNMINIDKIADHAFNVELEPEKVMDQIFVSRAFNASQTYDLVVSELGTFFERIPAKVLLCPGLPDIYIKEGWTSEAMQQVSYMASRLMVFTMQHDLVTVVSAGLAEGSKNKPAGGNALAHSAQVHVAVEEGPMYVRYHLTKHPALPYRKVSRMKRAVMIGTTPPLEWFVDEWTDE